jgi:hypothetical protein
MGQIRDRSSACRQRDRRPKDRATSKPMEKPKVSTTEPNPKVRYSDDGFWTTQHPADKAFSIEWFKTHLAMIPYCWEMLRLAISVSRISVVKIALGTLARACVDSALLYSYTRFVNEVCCPKTSDTDWQAQNSIVHRNYDLEKLCLLALLTPFLQVTDRMLMRIMYIPKPSDGPLTESVDNRVGFSREK